MERKQGFLNEISNVYKEYPMEFTIAILTLISVVIGTVWGINYTTYQDRSEEVRNDNKRLTQEIKEMKNDLLIYTSLNVEEGLIYQTDEYLYDDESISILNGEVTIIVSTIYEDSVNFEFSFLGKGIQSMSERWKEGSLSQRVEFEYKDKSYFIVVDKLKSGSVKFSVYKK